MFDMRRLALRSDFGGGGGMPQMAGLLGPLLVQNKGPRIKGRGNLRQGPTLR